MVERELRLGPQQAERHRERLQALGFENDEQLAAAIRTDTGALDEVVVREAVWASVRDKLAVANPKYLDADRG
jgi:hypothetical protein